MYKISCFSGLVALLGVFSLLLMGNHPPPNPKIEALLKKMTIEEKIGQLTLFTTDWESTGPTIREGYKNDIRTGACGALFNSHTAAFTRELQRIAVEESRMKIPLLFGYDVIHGYKTIFPIPLGEACSWDLEAMELSARIAATEAAAAGLHWTFAPMVDLSRDPRWGRVMEGAGEDTYLGCRIAEARVRGFQGKGIGNTDAVMACVKHYAAYGAPMAGKDYNTVDMSELYFREYYLPPYKAAVKAGAATVMTSFNDYNSIPASGNKYLMTDILRKEWGFKGFVVTDYTAINEIVNHGVVADEKEAGELAMNAGVDMDMQGAVYQKYLAKSIREGKVSIKQLDESVRRVLELKFKLGLFDDPYKFCDENKEKQLILSAPHREAARDIARKSIVLLKNSPAVLPLKPGSKIALIGPLAETKQDLIGNWSASGSGQDCVNVLEGLKNAGITPVAVATGCDVEGKDRSGFEAAVAAAMQADVVVAVIGERAWMSGEAAARSDISLPGVQEELIERLVATGKPVVVLLMNGRPLAIPDVAERASALLECWWLGTEAGNAIADVLLGKYNPSGKLTMTFPRSNGQVPIFYNYKSTGRPYDPNSKWTSKYIDQPNAPLFPFGYGLSYTTFEYSAPSADRISFKKGTPVNISVTIRNTGEYDGTETVQLYIRDLVGSVTRPVKELKAFKKIYLKKGQSEKINFTLTDADFSFFKQNLQFSSEPGEFEIQVGPNAAETQKVNIKMVL
jgi:beta-glucosidase